VLERATRLRRDRQVRTLVNILKWVGQQTGNQIEITLGSDVDKKLALQAQTYIRNGIRFIWQRFDKSVDSVADATGCQRAKEGPYLKRSGSLETGIPQSRCRNRECRNANFFREKRPELLQLCQELEKIKDRGQP